MTCREFIEAAESLTPSQLRLMETKNETLSAHARECAACGKWLESQRLLGSALQVAARPHGAARSRPEGRAGGAGGIPDAGLRTGSGCRASSRGAGGVEAEPLL